MCNSFSCGPNSQCREVNGQAVCTCQPNYIGSPPECRPQCLNSAECPSQLACINQKCANPCPHPCGLRTQCVVVNHSPICSCQPGYSGDPFTRCASIPRKNKKKKRIGVYNYSRTSVIFNNLTFLAPISVPAVVSDPCVPSPCGSFSQCRDIRGVPVCTCSQNYIGIPPNCRPECSINSECSSDMACINKKCRDPCPGSCGFGARCMITNHIPICDCPEGYTGNPFENCKLQEISKHYTSFIGDRLLIT